MEVVETPCVTAVVLAEACLAFGCNAAGQSPHSRIKAKHEAVGKLQKPLTCSLFVLSPLMRPQNFGSLTSVFSDEGALVVVFN